MNTSQFIGVLVFSAGILLIIIAALATILQSMLGFGESALLLMPFGGTAIVIGLIIILISVTVERLKDLEEERK